MLEEAFSRGWENLIGRWGGPMSFRLYVQPTMAVICGVLAGLRDARTGMRPFVQALFAGKEGRAQILREGWKDTSRVVILALVLDCIYQVMLHAAIYLLELLITVTVLAIVPYVIVRSLVGFMFRKPGTAKEPAERSHHSP
jgi:hypothetical protein